MTNIELVLIPGAGILASFSKEIEGKDINQSYKFQNICTIVGTRYDMYAKAAFKFIFEVIITSRSKEACTIWQPSRRSSSKS